MTDLCTDWIQVVVYVMCGDNEMFVFLAVARQPVFFSAGGTGLGAVVILADQFWAASPSVSVRCFHLDSTICVVIKRCWCRSVWGGAGGVCGDVGVWGDCWCMVDVGGRGGVAVVCGGLLVRLCCW